MYSLGRALALHSYWLPGISRSVTDLSLLQAQTGLLLAELPDEANTFCWQFSSIALRLRENKTTGPEWPDPKTELVI